MARRSSSSFADSIIKAGQKLERASSSLPSALELDDASIKLSYGVTMGVKYTRAVVKIGPQALAGFGAIHGESTMSLLSTTFPNGAVFSLGIGGRDNLTTLLIYDGSRDDNSQIVGIAREVPNESSTFEGDLHGDFSAHPNGSFLKEAALLEGAAWFVARTVENA